MEFLKSIFSDKALTYEELAGMLKDNKDIKLANLAEGKYVDKEKLDAKIRELDTANTTIAGLKETVKKFDGVDVQKLKDDLAGMETKYITDISNIKRDSALDMAIMQAKGRNPKAIKALLDMEKVKVKDDGSLEGLDLEALKKSDSYLFDVEEHKNEGTGFASGTGPQESGFNGVNSFISSARKAAGLKE